MYEIYRVEEEDNLYMKSLKDTRSTCSISGCDKRTRGT